MLLLRIFLLRLLGERRGLGGRCRRLRGVSWLVLLGFLGEQEGEGEGAGEDRLMLKEKRLHRRIGIRFIDLFRRILKPPHLTPPHPTPRQRTLRAIEKTHQEHLEPPHTISISVFLLLRLHWEGGVRLVLTLSPRRVRIRAPAFRRGMGSARARLRSLLHLATTTTAAVVLGVPLDLESEGEREGCHLEEEEGVDSRLEEAMGVL